MPSKKSNKLSIKLVKSLAGTKQNHKDTARALGLIRINAVVQKEDTPTIRGMINTIRYLVEVTE